MYKVYYGVQMYQKRSIKYTLEYFCMYISTHNREVKCFYSGVRRELQQHDGDDGSVVRHYDDHYCWVDAVLMLGSLSSHLQTIQRLLRQIHENQYPTGNYCKQHNIFEEHSLLFTSQCLCKPLVEPQSQYQLHQSMLLQVPGFSYRFVLNGTIFYVGFFMDIFNEVARKLQFRLLIHYLVLTAYLQVYLTSYYCGSFYYYSWK